MKTQKHLEPKLDKRLNFRKHLKNKLTIANKGIGMLKKLSNCLPRHSLVSHYKAFNNKIESLKYNAALAITEAIRESSKEKLYQELGFECISSERWLRKLCLFTNFIVNKSPNYFYNYVSTVIQSYRSRSG